MRRLTGLLILAGLFSVTMRPSRAIAEAGVFPKQLNEIGIAPSIVYDGDIFVNLVGGVRRGATYLGDLNLQLALNGRRLLGWRGGSVFLDGMLLHGGHPSALSGDAQGLSNIAGPSGWSLYEAWIQQNLLGDHISVLAGLYDLNSEFYTLQSAGLFLNSSFGIGPEFSQTGVEGPSIFPRTSFGVRLAVKPISSFVFRAAAMDAVPWERADGEFAAFRPNDGLLLVSEAAWLVRPTIAGELRNRRMKIGRLSHHPAYATKIALGVWHYTSEFDDLNARNTAGLPIQRHGDTGTYLLVDHLFFRRKRVRLSGFMQAGIGDPRVGRFGAYLGIGAVARGVIHGKPADEVGLGVATAFNGLHYIQREEGRGKPVRHAETAIELTALLKGNQWLAFQPDLQYIVSPDTDQLANALAAQFLFEFSFN